VHTHNPGGSKVRQRLGFLRASAARKFRFQPSAFGGPSRFRKAAAAISLAAFFVTAAQPAAGSSVPAGIQQPVAAQQDDRPALWVVSDADTVIYLFGTFHALDDRTNWFSKSVRAAFDASDELVLETLVPEDPAELHAILARNAITGKARVGEQVVPASKAPSFVASAGQAMSAGRSVGMSVEHGADAVLRRAANEAGKPVGGLESFEYQLRMFGSLPPAAAKPGARPAAGDLSRLLTHMQASWKRGDNDAFSAILDTVEAQSPATYKTLFVDRNANWAGWIADRLQQPGTVFVAVGTGHLIGRDSVQRKLAARGIATFRVS